MVPRILEKMANGVQEKMRAKGLGAKILAATVTTAQRVFEARTQNKGVSLGLLLMHAIFSPIRKKVKRQLFGEGFRHVVSGGAKLPVTVNTFFTSLGITIYEGYGLTETCVATNVNRIGRNKIGSVGPCLAEIEMKIADDGEILFRGPNVTSGYYNRPTATAAAWDADGWFHTGDLGHVDAEGSLFITGRKKELIVTSGGKKISPLMIEDKLAASPFISSAVVVGDGRQYCAALLVPDMIILRQWAERKGITVGETASKTPEIVARLQREIDHVNEKLSRFETIKRFRIVDKELTVENGFLTPTFKVKRALIEKTFKHLIDEMYADEAVA
jgi:long-chain acyl-CoA synthetase